MKDLGAFIFLTLAGPGFLAMGIRSFRMRDFDQSVPALEWLIDRAAGVQPPPRTAWDRRFARLQAGMLVILGTFFSLCLAAFLFTLFASE